MPWQVWVGSFAHDRPVLAPGELFAPASTAVTLQVDDLVAEEENPAASRWGRRGKAACMWCGGGAWRDAGVAKGLWWARTVHVDGRAGAVGGAPSDQRVGRGRRRMGNSACVGCKTNKLDVGWGWW